MLIKIAFQDKSNELENLVKCLKPDVFQKFNSYGKKKNQNAFLKF